MKINFLYATIVLVATVALTSFSGQVKTDSPKDSPVGKKDEPKIISTGQSKIIKTQGTNQYSQVRCGLQDKSGNLWFGTTGEGVYRYDGKLFTQFTIKDGLCNNSVQSILEDKTGHIWFGTDAGLCRYDGKTISAFPISLANEGSYFSPTGQNNDPSEKITVLCMLQDRNGKIWFGTSEGVYCFNGTTFTRLLDNDSVINKSRLHLKMTQYILEDKKGNIWFGCGVWEGEGLSCYDGKSITNFKPNGHGWIRYIVQDKNEIIWFGTRSDGNWRYDGKTYSKYLEKSGIGAPIMADKAGNIWFSGEEHDNGYGGNGGVWCYDGKSFKNFTAKDGMGDYGVWCIIEDNDENIWFGTRNVGLYKYNGKNFTNFSE
jgi:ligand-binding sensor domain-containing protein